MDSSSITGLVIDKLEYVIVIVIVIVRTHCGVRMAYHTWFLGAGILFV